MVLVQVLVLVWVQVLVLVLVLVRFSEESRTSTQKRSEKSASHEGGRPRGSEAFQPRTLTRDAARDATERSP
jgi:hypothetical protein